MDNNEKEEMFSFFFQLFLWFAIWLTVVLHIHYTVYNTRRIDAILERLENP